MADNTKDEVSEFFSELNDSDKSYQKFKTTWGALSSFLIDYEHLKGLNNLTQAEIAQKAGTTQSAISRLECMKGKPTYELLRRLSLAVGGELLVTPLAKYTVTLPYDLHEIAEEKGKKAGVTTQIFLESVLRSSLETPNQIEPLYLVYNAAMSVSCRTPQENRMLATMPDSDPSVLLAGISEGIQAKTTCEPYDLADAS